jgi:hypothetical protein
MAAAGLRGGMVYLALVIFDAIDRPWDPRRKR